MHARVWGNLPCVGCQTSNMGQLCSIPCSIACSGVTVIFAKRLQLMPGVVVTALLRCELRILTYGRYATQVFPLRSCQLSNAMRALPSGKSIR